MVGIGSRFFFELPLQACEEPAREVAPEDARTYDLRQLRVQAAEDNAINQKVLSAMLMRRGCEVTIVANGQLACERFRERRFDVILMDVQMPGMDGIQATRTIRREEAEHGLIPTPIIAFTAHASKTEQDKCIVAGMTAVVTKPVQQTMLVDAIAQSVSRVAAC